MKHEREKIIELIKNTVSECGWTAMTTGDPVKTNEAIYDALESAGYIAKEAPEQEPVNQKTSSTLKDEIRFNYTQEPQGTVGQVWDWQKAKWVDEKDLTPTEHSKSNYKRLDAMGFHDKLESIKRTMTQEEWDHWTITSTGMDINYKLTDILEELEKSLDKLEMLVGKLQK